MNYRFVNTSVGCFTLESPVVCLGTSQHGVLFAYVLFDSALVQRLLFST
jgi:hypothetical protein